MPHHGWHSLLWVWVLVWVLVRWSLCMFWSKTHTKSFRARLLTKLEEVERRTRSQDRTKKSGTEQGSRQKKTSRENRAVDKKSQQKSTELGSWQARQVDWTEQMNRAVSGREQSTEVGRSRLLGPGDPEAGLANVRGLISIPGGIVGISLDSLPMDRKLYKSDTNFSLLALGANTITCLFFFSSTL